MNPVFNKLWGFMAVHSACAEAKIAVRGAKDWDALIDHPKIVGWALWICAKSVHSRSGCRELALAYKAHEEVITECNLVRSSPYKFLHANLALVQAVRKYFEIEEGAVELPLQTIWLKRLKLMKKSDELKKKANEIYGECHKAWNSGEPHVAYLEKLWADGSELLAKSHRTKATADKIWADAIIAAYGNGINVRWPSIGQCVLENGDYYQ